MLRNKLPISVLIVVILSYGSLAQCFPEYECGSWSECLGGLKTRTCEDNKCGMRNIIERDFCIENCNPEIRCEAWGSCIYTEKVEDLIGGEIKFGGYMQRTCEDVNGCVDSFIEEDLCDETFKLNIKKIEKCGTEFMVVSDSESERQLAMIDLKNLKNKRLDLTLLISGNSYCQECYNQIKDGTEEGIDCGGNCKQCKKQSQFPIFGILAATFWFLALLFIVLFIVQIFFYLREKRGYFITR